MPRSPRVYSALCCTTLVLALGSATYLLVHADEESTASGPLSFDLPHDEASRKAAREYQESLQRPYAKSKTLQEAIEALRCELDRLGMKEYKSLFTEESVRAAISKALSMHEANYLTATEKSGDKRQIADLERHLKHFQDDVKPLYLQILDSGNWPPASYFFLVPSSTRFSGLSVSLHVTPSKPFDIAPGLATTGYAIRIVSVTYGEETSNTGEAKFMAKFGGVK